MSNSSCGKALAVKANKQSGCGTKGASLQLASAETYAAPSTKELRQVIKDDDIPESVFLEVQTTPEVCGA